MFILLENAITQITRRYYFGYIFLIKTEHFIGGPRKRCTLLKIHLTVLKLL
jgi:hypothetical protein